MADALEAQNAARAAAVATLRSKWLAANGAYNDANPPPGAYITEPIDYAGNRVQRSLSTGELVFGLDPDTGRLMSYNTALAKGYIGAVNPSYGYPQDTSFHFSDAMQFAAIAAPVVFSLAMPVVAAAETAAPAALAAESAPAAISSAPEYLSVAETMPAAVAETPEALAAQGLSETASGVYEQTSVMVFPPIPETVITPTTPASGAAAGAGSSGLEKAFSAAKRLLAPPKPAAPSAAPRSRGAAADEEKPGYALAIGAGIVIALVKGLL